METLYQQLAQLATTYASRLYAGIPLAEHEVLCYMQVCSAIEAFSRFQTAVWLNNAKHAEKQIEEEQDKEEL